MSEELDNDLEITQESSKNDDLESVSESYENIETASEIVAEIEIIEESENINAEEFKQILQEWALEIQAESIENDEESEMPEEPEVEIETEPVPEPIIIETDYSEYLETLTESRPFLTTPFEEYTVTEGFCLLFLLSFIVAAIYHMLRRFV